MAITGLPGLFELLSSKADGAIVRSLEDKSTKFVSSRMHNFSHLESIEVYTTHENVNLADVFIAIKKDGSELPSEKDGNAIKAYFQKVYPTMDFERVYISDMKKMVKWYTILQANNVEIKLTEEPAEVQTEVAAENAEEVKDTPVTEKQPENEKNEVKTESPAKAEEPVATEPVAEEKAPAKKTTRTKKAAAEATDTTAEKPAKKTAKKAAKEPAEDGEEKPKKTTTRKKKTEE